jgi:signal transduction histidine kinase
VCFGAVVCVAAIIIAVGISDYKNTALSELETVSSALSAEYGTVFDFENTAPLSRAAAITGTSIGLCDENGEVTASYGSIINPVTPQIREKAKSGEYLSMGRLEGMFSETVFVSVTLLPDGCYLEITADDENFNRYVINIVISTVLAAILGCAVIFAVLFYVTRHLLSPIENMTAAAKRFEKGDFSEKIEVGGDNELSYLASSLNDMAASIEQTEENRKNFISNVSHELKTPMTTIGGFADGILDGTIPAARHKEYLGIVSSEVRRLSRLVQNMLSLSAFEEGVQKVSITHFDLMPIFIDTAILFERKLSDKQLILSGLDRAPFFIDADEDLMRQVIFNLFENAVKFTDEGGEIVVDMYETAMLYSVSIKNTGKGISPDELARVFERFYKTDKSRGMDKTGVGLGLPIVSAIIKLHGGNLIAKSEPGKFTEFEFSINKI